MDFLRACFHFMSIVMVIVCFIIYLFTDATVFEEIKNLVWVVIFQSMAIYYQDRR